MENKDGFAAEIDHILQYLKTCTPNSEDYTDAVDNLKTLCEARSKKQAFLIEPEVLLAAGVNILGILLILRHEQFNVIASRAINFIRPR